MPSSVEPIKNRRKNKQAIGACALCGKPSNLTFEHIPPQCAFNSKPIYVQSHEHLTDENSYLYGKKRNPNVDLANRHFVHHVTIIRGIGM
jgi:hypothetical protein